MYDKYLKEIDKWKEKEINKLDDDFNIIFRYEVKNAIGMLGKGLFITTGKDNNVYLYSKYSCDKELKIDTIEIVKILDKYAEKLQPMDKLPFNNMLDGYINSINFKINNKWYNFEYSNLFAYDDETIDNNKYLNDICSFLLELYNYFESKDKTINEYFTLTLDDEEEQDEEE